MNSLFKHSLAAAIILFAFPGMPADAQNQEYWDGTTTNLRYNESSNTAGNWKFFNNNTSQFVFTAALPGVNDEAVFGWLQTTSTVNFTTDPTIGDAFVTEGTVTFNLAAHNFTLNNGLFIGNTVGGTLNANGGTLTAPYTNIGFGDGTNPGTGTLNLTSVTLNTGTAGGISSVGGDKGTGTLNLGSGASWSDGTGGIIAGYVGGTGNINLTDSTARLSTSGGFYLGFTSNGTGNLSITGGQASVTGLGLIEVADSAGDIGSITVSGLNSLLSSTAGTIYLGVGGSGTMTISNGGKVNAYDVVMGYSGTATGTLNLNSGGVLQTAYITVGSSTAAQKVNFNGGILQATLDDADLLSGFNAGNVTLLSGGGTVDSNGHEVFLSAVLGGTGSFTKIGASTLFLDGMNTYTGTTTISAGTVSVANLADGGSASGIGASGSGGTNLVINGGTLQYTGGGQSSNRLFTIGANGATLDASGSGALNLTGTGSELVTSPFNARTLTLTGSNTGANTLAGVITNSGTNVTNVTKTGSGNWVLSGANTYLGVTTINGGTLSATTMTLGGTASSIGAASTAASNLVIDGGTLKFVGSSNANTNRLFTIGTNGATIDASGTGSAIINISGITSEVMGGAASARTFTLTGTNTGANTFAGTIGDSGTGTFITSLKKTGPGNWTISGANTYTGTTEVAGGTLTLGASNAIGSASALIVDSGATFSTGGASDTVASLSGAGSVSLIGSGTLTVGANNQSTTFSGSMSAGGILAKTGTGTLTLTNANTYFGGTKVKNGTLAVQGAGASVFQSNSNLQVGVTNGDTGNLSIANGGSFTDAYGTIGDATGSTGTVTVTGVNANGTSSNWTNTFGQTFVGSDGTGTLNVLDGGQVISGSVSYIGYNSGTGIATVSGTNANGTASTWTNSSFVDVGELGTGTLTVANGGKVSSSFVLVADSGTARGMVNLNSGGVLQTGYVAAGSGTATLNFNGGILRSTGDSSDFISNFAPGKVTLNSGGGTIDTNSHAVVVNSILGGTGALSKAGTGTLTLSAANTYQGGTTVKAGTLIVTTSNSALGTGAVTLGDTTGSNSATLLAGTNGANYANAVVLATNAGAALTLGNTGTNTAVTFSGGVTGNNNLTINENGGSGGITFSSSNINNAGTMTNTGLGSGTTSVTGGMGSNVTSIIENSATSKFAINSNITVNSAGTTLVNDNSSGSSQLAMTATVYGTGNLNLKNNSSIDSGIDLSQSNVHITGTIVNSGTGTGSTLLGAVDNTVTSIVENSSTSGLKVGGLLTVNAAGTTLSNLNTSGTGTLVVSGGVAGTGDLILKGTNGVAGEVVIDTNEVNNSGRIVNTGTSPGGSVAIIKSVVGSNVTSLENDSSSTSGTIIGGLSVQSDLTVNSAGTSLINNAVSGGMVSVNRVVGTGDLTLQNNSATTEGVDVYGSIETNGKIINSGTGTGFAYVFLASTGVTEVEQNSATSMLQISDIGVNSAGTTLVNNTSGTAQLIIGGGDTGVAGTGDLILKNNSQLNEGITISGSLGVNNAGQIINSGTGSGSVVIDTNIGSNVTGIVQNSTTSRLIITGSYSAPTSLTAGSTTVDGTVTGNVNVSSSATVNGHGSINGTISGSGTVGPGNSPGILTASAVDPSGGLSFDLEFTLSGTADWSNAASSGNDVLHLTSALPFTSALTSGNAINLYFDQSDTTFVGGFFTNGTTDNLTTNILGATYNYFILDNTSGTILYNGNKYDAFTGSVALDTVLVSNANFGDGTVSGWSQQITVNTASVPEPSTWVMMLGGLGLLVFLGRRRALNGRGTVCRSQDRKPSGHCARRGL